jgi:hypothetical protein
VAGNAAPDFMEAKEQLDANYREGTRIRTVWVSITAILAVMAILAINSSGQ